MKTFEKKFNMNLKMVNLKRSKLRARLTSAIFLCLMVIACTYFVISMKYGSTTMESSSEGSSEIYEHDELSERLCPMYYELRGLDFNRDASKLCGNGEAHKQGPEGYPVCQLPSPFDEKILRTIQKESEEIELLDVNRQTYKIFIYKGNDLTSNSIRYYRTWMPWMTRWVLQFARKLPNATIVDVGCGIGTFSIQAAKLGLPVVSLDANIRSLLRLRLSLNAAALNAVLVWNYISPERRLKHLKLPAECDPMAVKLEPADRQDPVPVTSIRSEQICSFMKTKTLVLKLSIGEAEADFLATSGCLFANFSVAAVQLEWWPTMGSGKTAQVIHRFLTERGYKMVWHMPTYRPTADPVGYVNWRGNDTMWVLKDYLGHLPL